MASFSIDESVAPGFVVKIKVIGVGGGGGNMIDYIIREEMNQSEGMDQVEFLSANTDAQALSKSKAYNKIQLGERRSAGLGAGAKPEVGRESAEESYDQITKVLDGANLVFIAAGFGGGTGTGAAPIIARAAKEIGALTIGVVTTPFKHEMQKRMRVALDGIKELRKECDSVIVIPNEKLRSLSSGLGIKDGFKIVDSVLANGVSGMCGLLLQSGESDINVDFNDIRTAMSFRGTSLLGLGQASGENAAQEAVKNAIQSPLLEDIDIKGAKAIVINFKMNPNHLGDDVYTALDYISEIVGDSGDTEVFWGTFTDNKIQEDLVEVTIIATGINDKEEEKIEAKPEPKQVQKTGTDDLFGSYMNYQPNNVKMANFDDLDMPAIKRRMKD